MNTILWFLNDPYTILFAFAAIFWQFQRAVNRSQRITNTRILALEKYIREMER